MSIYQVISIIGVPSILTIVGMIYHREKSLRKGLQALLRAQMISDYNKFMDKGYMPIYAKQSFENCYKQYHNLGANGVIDKLYEEAMALPTSK